MTYDDFLKSKVKLAPSFGVAIDAGEANPALKPHQQAIVRWMVEGGRRACFAAFGLGKSVIQLETLRLVLAKTGGRALIVCPLAVAAEFKNDAAEILKWDRLPMFVRRIDDVLDDEHLNGPGGVYLTNYETVRDGKLDPREFDVTSLDEAAVLRGFGGTKTFREFMGLFAGDYRSLAGNTRSKEIAYRFVATATPSPNDYIELLAYAAFLGIMDVGQAKTRFFKRDSTKANKLTIHPHKEKEFWLWVASWALFVTKPSDLGFDDAGYDLPPLDVRWHEVPSDHASAGFDKSGQGKMFRDAAIGVQDAAAEKRSSLSARIAKMMEIRAEDPGAHRILWHDLEAEREAIEAELPDVVSVYGSQADDDKEQAIVHFARGLCQELAAKPCMLGAGVNLQRHCAWAIFLGIGFKFNDFIQACHRIRRFLQTRPVRIDLIYTEAERGVRKTLERKWEQHTLMVETMTGLIREFGLSRAAMAHTLTRKLGVERVEVKGENYTLVNNDCVIESRRLETNSIHLALSSWPFSTQYEYSPSFNDFGHNEGNAEFFQQLDYLTPEIFRALMPGRIYAVHVKDRIVPGGMTGLGFQTVYPFHKEAIDHMTICPECREAIAWATIKKTTPPKCQHWFGYLGMKTIVTDVVRENNQTYRLGWSEQCKDGSKMGVGMPEYLLLFRKPPTDTSNSYADTPVVKRKPDVFEQDGEGNETGETVPYKRDRRMVNGTGYSRARWQVDAHGFTRSSGNRLFKPEELRSLNHGEIFRMFRQYSLENVYDFEHHVRIGEEIDATGRLPVTFMLLQPQSWSPEVWTDITRMLTLNGAQSAKGKEMHLCLARGSLVLTRAEGYKPIQDVQPGDEVLTHKGRWRRVLIARSTGVQPVIRVNAHGVPGLTLTPDHKLWTRKVGRNAEAIAHARRHAKKTEPTWVAADETLGSYANLQLPPTETPSFDECRHWWIVGRWIADGHIGTRGDFWVSIGQEKLDHFLKVAGPHAGTRGIGTAVQIRLKALPKRVRAALRMCGSGAGAKHLPPEAFTLPTDQAHALLHGYLSGDGHYIASRCRWSASSVSRPLLMGLALLAQRVHETIASVYEGRPAGTAVIEGRNVNTKQEWILSFDLPSEERAKGQQFILADGAWKKVRSLATAGEVETWCLRVEEDESFTAEGCIVKNCPMQFDLADRVIEQFSMPGETVLDPFGGLMTVPYRAILKGRKGIGFELASPYFLDGCTYCHAAEEKMAMPDMFGVEDSATEAVA